MRGGWDLGAQDSRPRRLLAAPRSSAASQVTSGRELRTERPFGVGEARLRPALRPLPSSPMSVSDLTVSARSMDGGGRRMGVPGRPHCLWRGCEGTPVGAAHSIRPRWEAMWPGSKPGTTGSLWDRRGDLVLSTPAVLSLRP